MQNGQKRLANPLKVSLLSFLKVHSLVPHGKTIGTQDWLQPVPAPPQPALDMPAPVGTAQLWSGQYRSIMSSSVQDSAMMPNGVYVVAGGNLHPGKIFNNSARLWGSTLASIRR